MPQLNERDARLRENGARFGRGWRADDQDSTTIDRLSSEYGDRAAIERLVPLDRHLAGGPYKRVAEFIVGRALGSDREVKAVWSQALGGDADPSLSEPWFLRGFLEGALGMPLD